MTTFPVDSFKEAAVHLRRPFTPAAVKFKPQSVTKTGKTLCVAYIDARLVIERLNLVCPHLWHDRYEATAQGLMWCHLTVDGITRSDVGEGNGKALVSDALKRAGVHFGIGVPLYAVPQQFIDGQARFLSDQHQRQLRSTYERWLTQHGVKAFGEPLDHGDSEDSQGDAETDQGASPPAPAQADHARQTRTSSGRQHGEGRMDGRPSPETSSAGTASEEWVESTALRIKAMNRPLDLRQWMEEVARRKPKAGAPLKQVLRGLPSETRNQLDGWLNEQELVQKAEGMAA